MDESKAVAVVGIACNFPGAPDIDEFWRGLSNGENHVTEVADSRWSSKAWFSSDRSVGGKTYTRHAGIIPG